MDYKTIAVLLFFLTGLSALAAGERPLALWLEAGGGIASERNEQYSPLVYSGGVFRFEGGWFLRGRHLLWFGEAAYAASRTAGPESDHPETESELFSGRTGLLYILPFRPFSTTLALGPALDILNLATGYSRNGDTDGSWAGFAGLGPSLFLENRSLERWTFRFLFSLPLVSWRVSPVWGGYAEGFPDESDIGSILSNGEWVFFPELQFWNLRLSCGFRLGRFAELTAAWSLLAESHDTPCRSGRIHNALTLGLEIDLGRAHP